jgi:hypothetical protein
MALLKEIRDMKNKGLEDFEIKEKLKQEGIPPKQINDSFNQLQIKNAISSFEEDANLKEKLPKLPKIPNPPIAPSKKEKLNEKNKTKKLTKEKINSSNEDYEKSILLPQNNEEYSSNEQTYYEPQLPQDSSEPQIQQYQSKGQNTSGYNQGYNADGYNQGYNADGYNQGYNTDGYNQGYNTDGYNQGYNTDGYNQGYNADGYNQGYNADGYNQGYNADGYNQGYNADGYNQGYNYDTDYVIELSEQVFSQKIKKFQKEMGELKEFKTITSARIENISERLKKIEETINLLQSSVLNKVGYYGENLNNIKKEMAMIEDSFKKMTGKIANKKSKRKK